MKIGHLYSKNLFKKGKTNRMFNNKKEIFSFRKYKAYGLASAVIASMFLAQGAVSADVVTSPDGTKTTLSNDKASVTIDSNHFKESNDKTAKELYDAKEYEADKVTTGKEAVNNESKTVVSFETEDGTKLKDDMTKTATEEKELNYKVEGSSGKEYTGTETSSSVDANLEKQDTIEKDGERYKYVRTETKSGENTTLTNTTFNDVTAKASVEGMHNNDGSIKYNKIKNGSRVWVLEEKEDGTYGNYALIENAQDLSDEKIQEAAKTATTKFSKAEVEKLGGIKETDSIVVYESTTYAARKQSSVQYGKDFYFAYTAGDNYLRKSYIDDIFQAGLEGLEKKEHKYFYKGKEVVTVEDSMQSDIDHPNDNYYSASLDRYVLPITYYNVISDFLIANPESPIFAGKAEMVFWNSVEKSYYLTAFVARLLNESFNSKYNLTVDTENFTDKQIETKSDNSRPTEKKTYSFVKTELNGDEENYASTHNNEDDMWKQEISLSYSVENVERVRNFIKGYQSLTGQTLSDPFNGKASSDVTSREYVDAVFNRIASQYFITMKDQFTPEQIKELRSKFGDAPFLMSGHTIQTDDENSDNPAYSFANNDTTVYRNSLGVVTENTESFTYYDVITPLRAYRLNADNNTVRHVYEKVKRGSVIATHKDTQGNELLPQESIKTNEYDGEAYTTSAKQIPNKVVTDTTPEGFTRTTTTTYTLVENPANKDGNVIGGETITVPYVYKPTTDIRINGSVIATYKTEDGEKLTDDVAVKTDAPEQEAYTTSAKEFASKTETSDVNGLTKTTVTRYELIEEPANKDGNVVGNQTITVPYVYRKVVTETINGSVIATYKDTEGNVLAPQESVKTNVPDKEAYTTSAKVIPDVVTTDTDENGFTRKTTKVYTLVETPNNQNGSVVGGTVTTVSYVYNVKTIVETNGSVIATHRDTDGNELAPQESIKDNKPNGEGYTTSPKEIPFKTEITTTPEGFERTVTTYYELVETPSNKDGNVVGGKTTIVPYIYRPVRLETTNGSVIATYTDEEGNTLAATENVKTNVNPNQPYTTVAKTIEGSTVKSEENGLTKVTTTRYELIKTPENATGSVVGNKTIVVPYVYRKIVDITINGSVFASHKDESGNQLANDEYVKNNSKADEPYTTSAKTFGPKTETTNVNGLTKTVTTRYELVKDPDNKDGKVIGGKVIEVPYVYRKVVDVEIKGSVIATYKDEEGNILASEEKVITNQNAGTYYAAAAKSIQASASSKVTENGREVTLITYELIKTPDNETGEVVGGKTLVVPYVYRKVVTNRLVPNNPPVVEDETIKVTRFHSDKGEELQSDVTGFEDAPKTIGNYQFTEKTEMNDGNDVQTHIYTKIITEIPNEAPKVETEEYKMTRFMLEDRKTEINPSVEGLVKPIQTIGNYVYTGATDSNEAGDVITHIYKLVKVEKPIVSEIPKESPVYDKPQLKLTRYVLEDRTTEIKPIDIGLLQAPNKIDKYQFTGITTTDEYDSVRTHIYKEVVGSIPNEAPVHEKPEYKGGIIPNDAPVHEKPEYKGGIIPNDAPVHEKPEFNGGVVPNDPPVHEKPEFNGGVVPNDSPVHDKPELKIPEQPNETPVVPNVPNEPTVPTTPNKIPVVNVETPKPNIPTTTENVERPNGTIEQLPNTGSQSSNNLSIIGLISILFGLTLVKKQKED